MVLIYSYSDEPSGYAIIAVGIIFQILMQYVAQFNDKREA